MSNGTLKRISDRLVGALGKTNYLPSIKTTTASGKKKAYIVPEEGLTLGRDPELCNVLFAPSEPGISRCHCTVKYNAQTKLFLIEDLGSSYGTFLSGGKEVTAGDFALLTEGESFYVGSKTNEFFVGFRKQ